MSLVLNTLFSYAMGQLNGAAVCRAKLYHVFHNFYIKHNIKTLT